jgi:hypothetical protein
MGRIGRTGRTGRNTTGAPAVSVSSRWGWGPYQWKTGDRVKVVDYGGVVSLIPVLRNPEAQVGLPDHNGALQCSVLILHVIVEAAAADRIEVSSLTLLAGFEIANLIDFDAVGVLRMRIGKHVMGAGIVVDENHARARRHGHRLRTHSVADD